ncbi:MAG: sigma-70 family RNA polymerase sigma factor [Porphyromonadaceae bacterium]|nr:sigma-70 family RNA polymerase sigma factor [Porphyromonadaceae bacterium]
MNTQNLHENSGQIAINNDAVLFKEFQEGSIEAFSKLYEMNVNILFNYGCKILNDREHLKDCIHDVFIKIYSKRNDLKNVLDFKSYLFVTLKNKIFDEIRKKNRINENSIDDYEPVSSYNVEIDYIEKEKEYNIKKKVYSLLDNLSNRQREAVTLYFIEERKYEDICQIMDINYQSLRNLIYRSLTKLRAVAM